MKATLDLFTLSFVLLGLAQAPGAQEKPAGAPEQTPPGAQAQSPSAQAQTPSAPTQAPGAQEKPVAAPEQGPPQASAPAAFTAERLEQMAAPIALYPDALVAQILMGSTYPLEIVEAARWVEKNPALTGAALEEALKQHEWDPSVKALCGFPTVLKRMSDNLDWTRDLGDAFLAQKAELMDTLQTMRRKALEAGTLKTTEQQRVVQDQGNVVIEPANPDVIYVPTYSPAVYGPSWYYPSGYYSGWYDPWPWAFVGFGIGFFWGCGCWGSCDWSHHCCNVSCPQLTNFNTHTSSHPPRVNPSGTTGTTATWKHDPVHRAGVSYKTPQTAHEFGAAPGSTRVTGTQAHGTTPKSPVTSTHSSPSGPGTRAGTSTSPVATHSSAPPMNRGGTPTTTQRSGSGPASGRTTGDPTRAFPHGTAPSMPGTSTSYRSPPSYRSSPRSYSATPSTSRGPRSPGGTQGGFHSPSSGRSSGGWSSSTHGRSGSFGGGVHSGGRSSGGFSGGHSSGSFGGGGHSSGGFGGGGHGGSFGGGGHGGGGHR